MKLFTKEVKPKIYAIVYRDHKNDQHIDLETGYSLEEAMKKIERRVNNKGAQIKVVGTTNKDLDEMVEVFTEEEIALVRLKS